VIKVAYQWVGLRWRLLQNCKIPEILGRNQTHESVLIYFHRSTRFHASPTFVRHGQGICIPSAGAVLANSKGFNLDSPRAGVVLYGIYVSRSPSEHLSFLSLCLLAKQVTCLLRSEQSGDIIYLKFYLLLICGQGPDGKCGFHE